MWYINTVEYYSDLQKREMMPFKATWMDLEIIISQTEKNKYHILSLICGVCKNDTNEPTYETETDSQTQRTGLWLPSGRRDAEERIGSVGLAVANYYIQNG